MAHLEHLISRYLDGDLTSAEREEIDRLLADSPEARVHLRETMAIARAARRMPLMSRPPQPLEQSLFQRLQAEGLHSTPAAETAAPQAPRVRRWQAALAGSIALLLIVVGLWYGGTAPEAPQVAARHTSAFSTDAVPGATAPATTDAAAIDPGTANTGAAVRQSVPSHASTSSAVAPQVAASRDASSASVQSSAPAQSSRVVAHRNSVPRAAHRARAYTVRNDAGLNGASFDKLSQESALQEGGASNGNPPSLAPDELLAPEQPKAQNAVALEGPEQPKATRNTTASGGQSQSAASAPAQAVAVKDSGAVAATMDRIAKIDPNTLLPAHTAPSFREPAPGARFSLWSASLRGGVAAVNGVDVEPAREIDLALGLRMGDVHRVSLVVGVGPTASQQSLTNTGKSVGASSLSRDPIQRQYNGSGLSPSVEVEAGEERLQEGIVSEAWIGVGYNYSLPLSEQLSLEPGIRAGAGASAWRMGIELPVRYRMSSTMSIECAGSVARVIPGDVAADRTSANLQDSYIYHEHTEPLAFTTVGVQLGIRIDFGLGK